jgi:hypothetical protein
VAAAVVGVVAAGEVWRTPKREIRSLRRTKAASQTYMDQAGQVRGRAELALLVCCITSRDIDEATWTNWFVLHRDLDGS